MMQDGLTEQSPAFLSGGTLEGWSVPDLRGVDGVAQRWTVAQMAHYLATGRNDHATAVGAMRHVVSESLQYLSAEDHTAIATYLKHISGGERPMRLHMQGFCWRLSNEEVAELASFVRQGWHNRAGAVSAAQVAPLR